MMSAAPKSGGPGKVLVVDDESSILASIAASLRREGLDVVTAETGPDALEQLAEQPDVIVLDVMLPGMDGFEVCRHIREVSNVPILILSARGEEVDRVVGLEIGADDYLVKPFAMRELVARVRAMLRRTRMVNQPDDDDQAPPPPKRQSQGRRLVAGDIVMNIAHRSVTLSGSVLSLNPKEFDLLAYFVRHVGVVLTRDALLREVWGYQHRMDTRTVDVHIRWLRQKLEVDPGSPTRLLTVRGHGYRLVSSDDIPADE